MKINELVQVDTREETYTVTIPAIYDDDGNVITPARTEQRVRVVPILQPITRDMTPEEEAELAAQAAGVPAQEQTDAERIASLEQQIALLLGGDTN